MWQDLLRIPLPFSVPVIGDELVIHGFGLMLVLGFLCAMELARYLARKSRIDPELFANAALIGLVSGIVGARLSHVLENWAEYSRADLSFAQNFRNAINITSGGLTYYGGFLLAFVTLVGYAMWKKIPVRTGMDIIAPCLMLGLALGRVGCFLNGCCFGAVCDVPWAVSFPYGSPPYMEHSEQGRIHVPPQLLGVDAADELAPLDPARLRRADLKHLQPLAAVQHSLRIHPAQLYSAFTAALLVALLLSHFTLPHAPGTTFALMMMLEGAARFSLELVRVEPPVIGRLSISMVLALGLIAAGAALWLVFRHARRDENILTEPAAATA
ncbi:MAG TPA: prolipoprotein diacylglyceryl transferase [Tepidisphaeraceae bacterium]|nr:prolipoprotein diacylglyceryl transferase [Tepidisphaeraceae bacterium]